MTLRYLHAGLASLAVSLVASAPLFGTTSLGLIGDAGVDDANQAAVATMVNGWAPDAIVLLGDNYYSSVGLASGTGRYDRAVGRYHCAYLAGVAAGPQCAGGSSPVNRLWPILGNHDYSDAGIANYLAYFSLPGNERYYDTRVGDIHMFMLDSDEALRSPAEMDAQRAWLKAGLAASTAPFQVVALHHPPYTSSARGSYTGLRWSFAQWGADMVLSGHDHYYERLEAAGLPYLVNGAGGRALTPFPAPAIAESRAGFGGAHGAILMSADDARLTARFMSVDGVERDSVTVTRGSGAAVGGTGQPIAVAPSSPALAPGGARLTSRRVVVPRTGRVTVRLGVALGPGVVAGSRLRAAAILRWRGRVVARAVRVVTVSRAAAGTGRLTAAVRLGSSARRVLPVGRRPTLSTVLTVRPATGAVQTSRATGAVRVRAGR